MKSLLSDLSSLFVSRPSVMVSVASVLDVGDTLRDLNLGLRPNEADFIALWSDWRSVGIEIERAAEIESARGSGAGTSPEGR